MTIEALVLNAQNHCQLLTSDDEPIDQHNYGKWK
uniref:Uncharacterized protein n=1 Tax=Moniliophthora roreri TaxID=221103 RepID=A0A0W0FJF9_MONRR